MAAAKLQGSKSKLKSSLAIMGIDCLMDIEFPVRVINMFRSYIVLWHTTL
jgi:hypothetical protein